MAKKNLQIVQPENAYALYEGEDSAEKFIQASNSAVGAYKEISRAYFSTFDNIRPGISARPEFNRSVYEYFRPGEAIPKAYKDMVRMCDQMYKNHTLVRNTIDLMGDFACQGIKLVHPVKSIERFYNAWFKKVCGLDRSERFLSYLYRHAMVVVEAQTSQISKKTKDQLSALAQNFELQEREVTLNEIPMSYIFHNAAVVWPTDNRTINENTKYRIIKQNNLVVNNIGNSTDIYETERDLPFDRTFVSYFKRDEWDIKPTPFLLPLIKPAIMLEKLALADSAALDGAISNLRIIKIGNLEYKLAPTAVAVNKLNEMLQSNPGGGTLDIIWGPDIEVWESNTNVHQFLGEQKYVPHLHQMYIGLGIPPSLAGGGGTGTTNNYISLKFLIKRLQAGRQQLVEFWEKQIKWVQKAMKFARPAKVEFDFLELGDEATEKSLLIQLADRNLVSDEKLQAIFGYDSDMEKSRLNRENRERKSGRRVAKMTSMPDSLEMALEKIALQKGFVTPNQLGVQLEKDTDKDKTPFDKQLDVQKMKGAGQPGISSKGKKSKGRPTGSKDSSKRKQKAFKPKIKAALDIWTADAHKKINDIIKPEFLKIIKKSNFRQLTAAEAKKYEKLLFGVILATEPFSNITKKKVAQAIDKGIDTDIFVSYIAYKDEVGKSLGRELSLDETYKVQNIIYTSIQQENLNG